VVVTIISFMLDGVFRHGWRPSRQIRPLWVYNILVVVPVGLKRAFSGISPFRKG
jgi:hypothetical protein